MPLHIQSYTINRLSGPVEAHLLQPKTEYKQSLPILFMFGDLHDSMNGLCKKCECKGAGDSNCCLEIFSDTFLKLLDQLAQDRKVTFYTESFESPNQADMWLKRPKFYRKYFEKSLSIPYKGVMEMLRERLSACYIDTQIKKKIGKGSDELQNYCPTTMLNWDSSDLRQINSDVCIEELIDVESHFYEPILFRSLYYIFIQYSSGEEGYHSHDKDFNVISIAKRLGPIRARDFFHSLSLLLRDPIQFSTWFFSDNNSLKSFSLLSKVVKKSSLFGTEDIKKWMILELQYYTRQGSLYNTVTKRWSDYFEKLAQGKMTPLPFENIKHNTIMFIKLCLPFLDLYFILQSFSEKKGLSIGYFGEKHIHGIVDLLVNKLKLYTHISNHVKENKGEERCLALDKVDWDIDSVVEESNNGFSKPINIPKQNKKVSNRTNLSRRILRTNKILKSVKSSKQNKKISDRFAIKSHKQNKKVEMSRKQQSRKTKNRKTCRKKSIKKE